MKLGLQITRTVVCLLVLSTGTWLWADWGQWAKNAQHTSYSPDVEGQPLRMARWNLVIDDDVPTGTVTIHYATPMIDGDGNIYMTKRERVSAFIHRHYVVKLDPAGNQIWSYLSDYMPPLV